MLSHRAEAIDVTAYIDKTVRRAIFFKTTREIKRQNADADPDELRALIDEATAAARAEASGDASRS